jgi:CRP/FNR family transcriptional regulator, dissimilatory nitrate respiration regulator
MNLELERLLAASEYFRGLSDAHRRALAGACASRPLRKRETLFLEGEQGRAVFLLAAGAVQLTKSSPDGREVVIRTVGPGEIFAEVILFEQDRYPVTAVAVRRSTVHELPRNAMLRLLKQEDFRQEFIGALMRRMRYLAERILHLAAYDVEGRFFEFIRQQYGEQGPCTVALSKKDLAAAIGTTPETFSRLLLRLRKEGRIRWKGRSLAIVAKAQP